VSSVRRHPAAGRVVEVGSERLERWCAGFGARHGEPVTAQRVGAELVLTAADGATAALSSPFPAPDEVTGLAGPSGLLDWAARSRRCAVLLVRRGGYACAVVETGGVAPGGVLASKVGTRYVQSRTAAGGWSQQRFARRRENQARDLVRAVADVAARVLTVPELAWLVTGGDRPLVEEVFADGRLSAVRSLPRGPHLAVGDPRADLVKALPERLRTVRVVLTEPESDPANP
jgi:Actinobacteria/chloroflexi VLRF1 release factor